MKIATIILLVISGLAQARVQPLNQPTTTLLRVTCYNSDGTKNVSQARVVYFNAEKSQLVGIGLGPNRQDDGFRVFKGNCAIENAAQSSPETEE